jgi:hypothetical protein
VTTLLKAAGDKLLDALAPKRRASACTYPSYCAYQFRGCGGGFCYYYYQYGQYCYVGDHPLTNCTGYLRRYQGCC